jgi:hypothetical protein
VEDPKKTKANPQGKLLHVATATVLDSQPPIPTSWNDKSTKPGEYILLSAKGVVYTKNATQYVLEYGGKGNYLQPDWDLFPAEDDDGEENEWTIKDMFEFEDQASGNAVLAWYQFITPKSVTKPATGRGGKPDAAAKPSKPEAAAKARKAKR